MNQFVPDCTTSNMGDAFAPLGGEDDGLMELLWCNGHVVMQSQAPRKPQPPPRSSDKPAAATAAVQDDEAAAWFQYPVEDPFERDLFSELFGETTSAGPGKAAEQEQEEEEEERAAMMTGTTQSGLMLPPKKVGLGLDDVDVSGDECAAAKTGAGVEGTKETGGESSMLTIGSSFCGSNHVQATTPRAAPAPRQGGKGSDDASALDAATVTSSSMQPRNCAAKAGPPSAAHRSGKRKQPRDAAETEDAEFESAAVTCEPAQKATTAKRRRAAEVHNLSERRRRDRINEKMKALQELIPHCNKTDKASMLDEAIEYLKSLQLQLQVMWMGGGMAAAAPMMFPAAAAGVHQYMQRVVGPPPHVASMPRMPPFMAPPAVQSPPVADTYARCLAVDASLQPPGTMHYLQGMSFYHQHQQQQQTPAPPPPPNHQQQQQPVVPGGSLPAAPTARTFPSDSTPHKKHENQSKNEIEGVSS